MKGDYVGMSRKDMLEFLYEIAVLTNEGTIRIELPLAGDSSPELWDRVRFFRSIVRHCGGTTS
jgi:hypothetical protein